MLPVGLFGRELLPALVSQLVKARATVVFRQTPFAFNPAPLLNPVQSWIERPFFHLKHVFRQLLDSLPDPIAMHGTQRKRLEHQHVQRSLGKIRFLPVSHLLISLFTSRGEIMADITAEGQLACWISKARKDDSN